LTATAVPRPVGEVDYDRVPGDPNTSDWKRRARLHQQQWREARGYPIGHQPYSGKGANVKPIVSRVQIDYARCKGVNFLSPAVRDAVKARLRERVPDEMINRSRLWADLLSSMPLCFNLFGELWADAERARAAVRAWWPDAPRGSVKVLFEHSPGRGDPDYLGNRSAFDVAFEIDPGDGRRAIIGVETKYHEHAKKEALPSSERLPRYLEVTEKSNAFRDGWRERIRGTELQQIWLDHLLVLSMTQHRTAGWSWGKFVLAYPKGNPSFARAAEKYRAVLRDDSTFEARTLDELVATPGALPSPVVAALQDRYLIETP
jgi:hypothetical protein